MVIAHLLRSSLGTVSPKARRPSPAMNLPMSMASWTSPRASVSTLPISRVISRASSSLRRSMIVAAARMISPRRGHGVAPPAAERALRGRDRGVNVRSRALREDADHLAVASGVARFEGAAARRLAPLAADEVARLHQRLAR